MRKANYLGEHTQKTEQNAFMQITIEHTRFSLYQHDMKNDKLNA